MPDGSSLVESCRVLARASWQPSDARRARELLIEAADRLELIEAVLVAARDVDDITPLHFYYDNSAATRLKAALVTLDSIEGFDVEFVPFCDEEGL